MIMKKQLLFFVLMLLPMVASAYDIEVQNADGVVFFYNYTNGGKELEVTSGGTSGGKYTGNVVIPEEVTYMNRTRKVTSIGNSAFYDCYGLTSITIPNSVTSIGDRAFFYCYSLTSITIPSSVTRIDDRAFFHCGLTSIIIPNSVTRIGNYAFEGCSSLTSVVVESGNTRYDSRNNCNAIIETASNTLIVGFKNSSIPNSVTSIGNYAFQECSGLTSITIPNSVTSIGNYAFHNCSGLISVTIPNSVTSIGNSAFYGCSGLKKVVVPDIAAWCGITFGSNPLSYAHHLYSDEYTEIKELVIPNSVTDINNYAFSDCSGLTSVTIPNSVTSIGYSAFKNCTGLTSITIPSSVTSIGGGAFYCCDIPTVITQIENPFSIAGKTSESRIFTLNTYNNATLYVPKGTIEKYKATNGWKDFVFIDDSSTPPTPPTPPTPEKCEKPTISYQNGKLMLTCATDGAECITNISDADIKTYYGNEILLTATYNISVYATKEGYENSEVATATLCWIDAEPRQEGVAVGAAQIAAKAVLVKTSNNYLTIEGLDDHTPVQVYTVDGKQAGSATSHDGAATIATCIRPGSIAIVRVGDMSVKVIMK